VPYRKTDDILKTGRAQLVALRDRLRVGLAGRSRQVLTITALAGVSSLGLTFAMASQPSDASSANTVNAAVVRDTNVVERNAVAGRVDRSTRTASSAAAVTSETTKTVATTAHVAKPAAKAAPTWVVPMQNAEVTSCYGMRWGVLHAGIDFARPAGTPIQAVGAGTVFASGWTYSGYGISVVIDHGNGLFTHYAHMSEAKVSVGDKVQPGTVLGLEGATGDAQGPHLHFEVHQGGMWNQIDPAPWLRDRGIDTPC
jgi:murein DD-endopeptidase MepM/ murein hydrolase activator NlpD